jgi:membrane protease YdiL (CAAX protease family)
VYGDALSKVVVIAVFVFVLRRFGWLGASGLTRLANRRDWLVIAGLLIYLVFAKLYAFTGTLSLSLPSSPLQTAYLIATFPGSLLEEVLCRALVLIAMMLAWGDTKRGIVKSVVLSSVFFGMAHLVNVVVRPVGVVLFQAVVVSLPGILYGALVLKTRSLWPTTLIHWLTNAAVNMRIAEFAHYQETSTMWVWLALFLIPTTAYSAYVLWKLPDRYEYDQIDTLGYQTLYPTRSSGGCDPVALD